MSSYDRVQLGILHKNRSEKKPSIRKKLLEALVRQRGRVRGRRVERQVGRPRGSYTARVGKSESAIARVWLWGTTLSYIVVSVVPK